MHRKEIETFVQVLKHKSFYEAACELNYSPSVISKQISSLEKELEIVLFNRSNRPNSISLTKEGEALKHNFMQINESFIRLQEDVVSLKRSISNALVLGRNNRMANCEVIDGFLTSYPDIQLNMCDDYLDTLEQLLYRKLIDGAFLRAQSGSENYNILDNLLNDTSTRAVFLSREPNMYLTISDTEPLARYDEAPLSAFSDFFIVFHADKLIREKGGQLDPFLRISEKNKFKLKTVFIAYNNKESYDIVTKMKIAIPSPEKNTKYPGLKNVRVSDWDSFIVSYFLALKANNNRTLESFIKYIRQATTSA